MASRAANDILKEYLIAIGFKVDEEKSKKADRSLEALNKRITEIGVVAVGASVALSESVTRIAASLENVFFASQRTGASVANIKALELSAQQVGVTAEESRGMLEAFSRSLRMNPGLQGYLQSMGVDASKDKVEVLMQLVGKLRSMPFPIAARIGQQFGISDDALLMMTSHYDELLAAQEKQRKLGKDIKYDEMAERAHKFMQELRELGARFEGLTVVMADRFLPVGEKIIHFLESTVDLLLKADKATDGWSSRVLGIATALGSAKVAIGLFRGALGMLGIGEAAAGAGSIAAGGTIAGGLLALGALFGVGDALYVLWKNEHMTKEERARQTKAATEAKLPGAWNPGTGRFNSPVSPAVPAGTRRWKVVHGVPHRQIWNGTAWIEESDYHGLVVAQSTVSTQSVTSDTLPSTSVASTPKHKYELPPVVKQLADKYALAMGIDIDAFEALLRQEHGSVSTSGGLKMLTSSKGAYGPSQLMPDTARMLGVNREDLEDNIRGGATLLRDLVKKYGDYGMAFAAYNAGPGAVDKYHGVPPYHETQDYVSSILKDMQDSAALRAQMENAQNYRLGQDTGSSSAVTMTQKTDIHVNGTQDTRDVADAVTKQQDRVNGDLLRNLQGAMR